MYSDPAFSGKQRGVHPFKQWQWNMQLTLKERGNKTPYIKGQNPYAIERKLTIKIKFTKIAHIITKIAKLMKLCL